MIVFQIYEDPLGILTVQNNAESDDGNGMGGDKQSIGESLNCFFVLFSNFCIPSTYLIFLT